MSVPTSISVNDILVDGSEISISIQVTVSGKSKASGSIAAQSASWIVKTHNLALQPAESLMVKPKLIFKSKSKAKQTSKEIDLASRKARFGMPLKPAKKVEKASEPEAAAEPSVLG